MFYKFTIKDHIRVSPEQFEMDKKIALLQKIKEKFDGMISKDMGFIIDCTKLIDVGQGRIITGDGAIYHPCTFELVSYLPENNELLHCQVREITDFGAFLNLGPIDGMVHLTQTMDDFVSFSKDKVLQGKESKNVLKIADKCRAKIIAVSYKDLSHPKIGLTMRQKNLGNVEWKEKVKK